MRFWRPLFLMTIATACVLSWTASPAPACINDEETNYTERQFVSSYNPNYGNLNYSEQRPSESTITIEANHLRTVGLIGSGIGVGLLVGGIATARRKREPTLDNDGIKFVD